MFLSKHKNGIYYIYYKNKSGKRTSISTKSKTKNGALEFLLNFKEVLKMREMKKTIPIQMEKFFFQYLVYSELVHSYRTTLSEKTTFNLLNKYFGNIQIEELTRYMIMDFVQYRLRKVSAYAVTRDIQYLRGALNWGIQKNYLENNQCIGVKKPRLPEIQPIYFTREEFDRLITVINNEDLKHLIIFAVNTGLRQMELLMLQWNQINFVDRVLYVNNLVYMTKTKKISDNLRCIKIIRSFHN
ncbi:MAG: tyrosine-type recombinase/integrase [Ignavibacteriaceae bacterium]